MRKRNLDGLLRDWGYILSSQLEETGLACTTTIYKMMVLGVNGAAIKSGKAANSSYWPKKVLVEVNIAVIGLPVEQRSLIVGKHVLCANTFKELGRICACSTSTAWRKYLEAEQSLKKTLNCW